jgi:hypothetical protein
MNEKLRNMDTPGVKELECGCVCERLTADGGIKVLQACPKMAHLFLLAGEKEPDPKYLFSPADDIMDHIFEGIAKLEPG